MLVTRKEARTLYDALNRLEMVVSIIVWDAILQRLNATNKIVQDPSVNLSTLPNLFQSLIDFMQFVRENYDSYEKEALSILPNTTYTVLLEKSVFHEINGLMIKMLQKQIFLPMKHLLYHAIINFVIV
jgi:hypothetical protein